MKECKDIGSNACLIDCTAARVCIPQMDFCPEKWNDTYWKKPPEPKPPEPKPKEPGFFGKWSCPCYQHCMIPYIVGIGVAIMILSILLSFIFPSLILYWIVGSTIFMTSVGAMLSDHLCTVKCSEICNLETKTK